jgi:hypothetical protein
MLHRAGCRKRLRIRRALTADGDEEDFPADWFKDPQHRSIVLIGERSKNYCGLLYSKGTPPGSQEPPSRVRVVATVKNDSFVDHLKTPGPMDFAQSPRNRFARNLNAGRSQRRYRYRRILSLMDTLQSDFCLLKRCLDELQG